MFSKFFTFGKTKKLLAQAGAMLDSAQSLASVQALQIVGVWLKEHQPTYRQRNIRLQLLEKIDIPVRAMLEQSLQDMIDAYANQARLNILLQTATPLSELLLELSKEALTEEAPALKGKSASSALLFSANSAYLYWLARSHAICSVRKPVSKEFPWPEVYARFEEAVRLMPAERGKLQKQMAYLFLLVRSLSSDLNGRQMLIAERLIQSISSFIDMGGKSSPQSALGVDYSKAGAPTLITQIPTQQGKGIYFGLDRSLMELIALENLLSSTNKVPSKFDPHGKLAVAETLSVIKHLKNRWSGKQVKRNAKRVNSEGSVQLVYDYVAVRRCLAQQEAEFYQRTSAKTVEKTIVQCGLEDISATGYGLMLKANSQWAQVGMVVAIKQDAEHKWALGIIRRLILREGGKFLAGIQLLSTAPESVRITERAATSQWEQVTDVATWKNHLAILMEPSPLNHNQLTVMLAKADLKAGQIYSVQHASQQESALKIVHQQEIGADFIQYTCERAASGHKAA